MLYSGIYNIAVICECNKSYNDTVNAVLTSNNVLYSCYSSLCLVQRNQRSKHGPQQQVLRGPSKVLNGP